MNLRGVVSSAFPRVELALIGAARPVEVITFVVDTAFDGQLALPRRMLPRIRTFAPTIRRIILANGQERDAVYCLALIEAEAGEQQVVEVLELEDGRNPLIGVELLPDHLLTVELTDGGEVLIEPIQ